MKNKKIDSRLRGNDIKGGGNDGVGKAGTAQGNLLDWIRQAEALTSQTTDPVRGSLDIDSELRAAISDDLKHAVVPCSGRELSRYQVAARMSELVGHEVTASQLYNWTAEAHDKHRFPCQYLPAFVIATGGQRRAFECLSRHSGLFALPGPEALRAAIQRLDEQEKRIKQEKAKSKRYLREMEGK